MIVPIDSEPAPAGAADPAPVSAPSSRRARRAKEASRLDPALEAQLLRERRRQYGRAVREELAKRHRSSQAAKQSTLEARLAAPNQGLAMQEIQPPARFSSSGSSGGRRAASPAATRPSTANTLQAILSVAQRLEQKLSALDHSCSNDPALALDSPGRPSSKTGGKMDECQGTPSSAQAEQSPGNQSPCSSLELGVGVDTLPSSWGLHASRKLREVLRCKKEPSAQVGRQDDPGVPLPLLSPGQQQQLERSRIVDIPPEQEHQQHEDVAALTRAKVEVDLVEKLLQMEAEGDPFSIINIYLEEQAQKQQRARKPLVGVAASCGKQQGQPERQQQEQNGRLELHAVSATLPEPDPARPASSASDQENVSANVAGSTGAPSRPLQLSAGLGHQLQQGSLQAGAHTMEVHSLMQADALRAELVRLNELRKLELELGLELDHLGRPRALSAAQRDLESLAAAADRRGAQSLLLGSSASNQPTSPTAMRELQLQPPPQQQPGTRPGCDVAKGRGVPAVALAEASQGSQELQMQLVSLLHLSQQQSFLQFQHLARLQEQQVQQQQLALQRPLDIFVSMQQPVSQLLDVAGPKLPAVPPTTLELERSLALPCAGSEQQSPVQQEQRAASAVPREVESAVPECMRDMGDVAAEGELRSNDHAPMPLAKQQYLHSWLDGATVPGDHSADNQGTEDSVDPDHEEEGGKVTGQEQPPEDGTAVACAAGEMQQEPRPTSRIPAFFGGLGPTDAAEQLRAADNEPQEAGQQSAGMQRAAVRVPRLPSVWETAVVGGQSQLPGAEVSAVIPTDVKSAGQAGLHETAAPAVAQAAAALQPAVPSTPADSNPQAVPETLPSSPEASPSQQQQQSPQLLLPVCAQAQHSPQQEAVAQPCSESSRSSDYDYSMDFDEFDADVEFSYTEQQHTTTTLAPLEVGSAAAAAAVVLAGAEEAALPAASAADLHHPASPRQLGRLLSPPPHGSRPTSPSSPRHHSMMSPHALDDKYPTPPRSPNHLDPCSASPRPGSPLGLVAAAGDGPRPGSPSQPPLTPRACSSDGEQRTLPLPFADGGMPPPGPSPASTAEHAANAANLLEQPAWSPSPGRQAGAGGPESPVQQALDAGPEPPASPPAAAATSSALHALGSPRVEDDTVVQSEAHARHYISEVLDYFWQHRAQAYAQGEQPLDLEGFLLLERRRQPVGDPQHIFNKLLFDAANEALAQHYNKSLTSFAGKVDLQRALLDRQRVSQFVTSKVLAWAGMGCTASDLHLMLQEDAAEEERTLALMTDMMLRELAAEGRSRTASPAGMEH